MINELAIAALSLSFLFGGNDEKASFVKGESAFTCTQINAAAGRRDYSVVGEMLDLSLRQVDKAYTDDSTIEMFYRDRLRGENSRYRDMFSKEIVETCIENPKLGVLQASTIALNEAYKFSETQPIYAICKAYNEKKVSYEGVIALASNPQATGLITGPRILAVQADPSYGDTYLQDEISSRCTSTPDEPVLETMAHASEAAHKEAARNAEALEMERIRAQEILAQQRDAETKRKEFEKYAPSLYASEDNASCYEYHRQYSVATYEQDPERQGAYKGGLAATVADAVKLTLPHQQAQLTTMLSDDSKAFFERVDNSCHRSGFADSILEALNLIVAPELPRSRAKAPPPTEKQEAETAYRLPLPSSLETANAPEQETSESVKVVSQDQKRFEPATAALPEQNKKELAVSNAFTANRPPIAANPSDPFSRIAIINDPDGYTNVRAAANGKGKIISRIQQDERFSTYAQQGAWWAIRKSDGLLGYVHKSRITMLPLSLTANIQEIFNGDMLGTTQRYFESVAGIPRESYGDQYVFRSRGCNIIATINADKVSALRMEVAEACQPDLTTFIGSYAPQSAPPLTTSAFAESSGGDLMYSADCLSMCGNAYDPSVYALWAGPHAVGFLQVMLEVKLVGDDAITASSVWQDHMIQAMGDDYVIDTRFNCDRHFDSVANHAFKDVKVTAVTVGYDLKTSSC